MALAHSPQTVTNGLVFYYDMGNPQKSWKGAPTTNSVPSADIMSSWNNYYRTVASSTFTTEFGTTGYRFTNQPSWNGVQRGITIPSTGTYTFSAWFRYLGGSVNNNGATVYISGYGGGDAAVAIDKSLVGVWQRRSITLNCTNTSMTFYLISYGGTDNGTGNPDFSSWEVTMPQVEPGSFATPFVAGTRSNTQAILDLTNSNTITANVLTYNNNNSFSFNGSSNLITFPENSAFNTQTPTVEVWVKTNATTQNGFWFEKGTVNSQYALFQEGENITWRHTTNVGSLVAPAASFINTAQYAQVVGTYTPGSRQIYVNGVQVASDALNYTLPTNTNGCSIGAYGGFSGSRGYYYNGNIDIVKVYNRALSAAEVQQNFNALRGRYGV
jgi:hypothetical protein